MSSRRSPNGRVLRVRRGVPAAIALCASSLLVSAGGATAVEPDAGPAPAPGQDAKKAMPVTLVDVKSDVDVKKTNLPDATRLLRQDLLNEIAAFDWAKAQTSRRYKISASVVKLESAVSGDLLRTSCAVSITIREAKGGALLTSLLGRAKVEDAPAASTRAERLALAAAARSAVVATAEAIRRAP